MSLTLKQKAALEALTCGEGLSMKEVAERSNSSETSLRRWRYEPEYKEFQDELKRLNDIRWQAAEDAARQSCLQLCKDKNQKMVEFVLKNAGLNPATKVEATVDNNISITIGDDDD